MASLWSAYVIALFAAALQPSLAANTRFVILHFNDFHARVDPDSEGHGHCFSGDAAAGRCHGGLARMKTFIEQERAKGLPVIVLNAGDNFVGTEWDNRYQGSATAHFMNQLGITAMTLGNHEFDFGPDVLLDYIRVANHPVISSNFRSGGHEIGNHIENYHVTYVPGEDGKEVKVGICGPTTLYTNEGSRPWPGWVDDDSAAAHECVSALKNEGVNIIILLTHIGFEGDKVLAQSIPDVDIVIGGHSHYFLYDGTPPALSHGDGWSHRDYVMSSYPTWMDSSAAPGKKVPVLTAKAFSRYVGRLEVEFDEEGNLVSHSGAPVLLGDSASDAYVEPDKFMADEIQQYLYTHTAPPKQTLCRWKHW